MTEPFDPVAWRVVAEARRDVALGKIDAAVTDLNTLIAAVPSGPAWDNLTPAQRTGSIRMLAQDVRAIALDYRRSLVELLDAAP